MAAAIAVACLVTQFMPALGQVNTVADKSVNAERRGVGTLTVDELRLAFADVPQRADHAIDPGRSLFIHSEALLSAISFEAVLDAIAESADFPSGEALYRQWWTTWKSGTTADVLKGLACATQAQWDGMVRSPHLNPFLPQCDRAEAVLATANPFAPVQVGDRMEPPFRIVGAVNRVDLMVIDGAVDERTCGEYRLVAGMNPAWRAEAGLPAGARVLINFEGSIANPASDDGRCRAVQRFWECLGFCEGGDPDQTDAEVAERLRKFFLEGATLTAQGNLLDGNVPGPDHFYIPALMHAEALGGGLKDLSGQIRTNTFDGNEWLLREFEFREIDGHFQLVLRPTGGSLQPELFSGNAANLKLRQIQALLANATKLKLPSINNFAFDLADSTIEASEMRALTAPIANFGYDTIYNASPMDNPVRDEIDGLATGGFTVNDVLTRLEALSCAGCHRNLGFGRLAQFTDDFGNPVKWVGTTANIPEDMFTYVDERAPMADHTWNLALGLQCTFLPHRELVMRALLGLPTVETALTIPGDCPSLLSP